MPASRQCSHYVVQTAASTLDFDAKSTLHGVHGKGSALTGFVEALCEDGTLALDPPPKMHVEFPIERLVSGNGMQDKEMWKLLDSKRNPLIRADSCATCAPGAERTTRRAATSRCAAGSANTTERSRSFAAATKSP